jgi:predicted nuclease of restriction endonuclease-like RecB superfamily
MGKRCYPFSRDQFNYYFLMPSSTPTGRTRYTLTSEARLVSHYSKPPAFDSLLEEAFFKRWARLKTPWTLEREVEIIDLKGTVFLPDFALRHPDGRTVYMEIVGFWHPDYLKRKLEKVRRAGLPHLILAVSERLQVGEGDLEGLPGPVIFFKGKLDPGKVREVAEGLGTV